MAITYIKKADKTSATGEDETGNIVSAMLAEIKSERETAVLRYGEKLDGFTGDPIVTREQIEAASASVPQRLKDDIQFALERVQKFAEAQKSSISEFETELSPGLWAGQKLIPIETAGCYIPGGRYAHVASAIMSIATAKVASVEHIIACSAPKGNDGPNPAILYTMDLCGADTILALGGGSWAKLGSDGAWVPLLAQRGIPIAPLKPSNCGFDVAWSDHFRTRFAGHPLKSTGCTSFSLWHFSSLFFSSGGKSGASGTQRSGVSWHS